MATINGQSLGCFFFPLQVNEVDIIKVGLLCFVLQDHNCSIIAFLFMNRPCFINHHLDIVSIKGTLDENMEFSTVSMAFEDLRERHRECF